MEEEDPSASGEREIKLEENMKRVYLTTWGQCSEAMKAKVMAAKNYETKAKECDRVWLLKTIRGIANRFEGQRNIFLSIDDARSAMNFYRQDSKESNHNYYSQFKYLVEAFECLDLG